MHFLRDFFYGEILLLQSTKIAEKGQYKNWQRIFCPETALIYRLNSFLEMAPRRNYFFYSSDEIETTFSLIF